ncbi:MAG TPA: N-acetyl-gamma-glutamyl-phosphate reductase [bacterium]|nr:N-acetyl-gamma-glutamyl-phosphate reductase [bacterium]
MARTRVSIIGASGYGGGELARLLAGHPEVELVHLTAETRAGEAMADLYPNLRGFTAAVTEPADAAAIARDSDVVFLALPNGRAMTLAPHLVPRARVIDLGADFRFRDARVYEQWYATPHAAPELLADAVYGLTEFRRAAIRRARLVGNPGCYPTAALLAALPLLQAGVVEPAPLVIDAKSGVSGAGRSATLGTHFAEVNENVKPYNVVAHRHTPEIEQELAALAEAPAAVAFIPHLIPMTRGILATVYLRARGTLSTEQGTAILREAYAGEPFVRVLADALPQTKATSGSNFCDVAVRVDARTGTVIAMAALDNLVKGASGQAVQNMNVMLGFPEELGLRSPGLYP